MLVHIVLFWFKSDSPPDARQQMLADCGSVLKKIPSVRHLWAGRAVPSSRPVVDSSYDVGLCVVVDDQPGLAAYLDHPLHQEFLTKHKAHWQRIVVYDMESGA